MHICTEVWVGEAVTQEEGATCRIRNLGLSTCWAPAVCGPGNGPGLPEPWVLMWKMSSVTIIEHPLSSSEAWGSRRAAVTEGHCAPRQCFSRRAYERSGRNVLTLQGELGMWSQRRTSCWNQHWGLCDMGVRSCDTGVLELARIQALPLTIGNAIWKRGMIIIYIPYVRSKMIQVRMVPDA